MFKSLSGVCVFIMLSLAMITGASASTYAIMGGVILSGSEISVTPIPIPLDYDRVFVDKVVCDKALNAYLTSPVTGAQANSVGDFPLNNFKSLSEVHKTSAAKCIPIN